MATRSGHSEMGFGLSEPVGMFLALLTDVFEKELVGFS